VAAGVAHSLSARHAAVCARVEAACRRAGRDPAAVRLVAVSKGMPAEAVRAAVAAGQRRFGESYVQEWRAKRAALADLPGLEWHFVGRLQRNKATAMVDCALVHSVADARVAAAIDRAAARAGTTVPVLVEVNVAGEATKEGVAPGALPAFLRALRALAGIRVAGLMAVPPPVPPEEARGFFRALRTVRDRQERAEELAELSMGMSGDFEVAIEEGATLVRVGTAIFGPRPGAGAEAAPGRDLGVASADPTLDVGGRPDREEAKR
jgi:pyridoxal phosphate enzyme (YggS family)